MRSESDSDPHDAAIARLADRQYGVVARRQLVAMGVGNRAVGDRLRRRSLIRLHRGVYAVGHRRLTIEGRWLAAVLAVGSGAVLSHRDAAALHGMRATPESRKVSVTTTRAAREIPGVWLYRRRVLPPDEVEVARGVPVTSPARTLVDLAPMLTAAQLAGTLGEADRRDLLDLDAVEEALKRARTRHGQGHRRLKAALDAHRRTGAVLLRSALEERFLDLVLNAGLPQPHLNAPTAGYQVDALWPDCRLVVELDGWAHHKERHAAARDREKTNELQLHGYTVLRFLHADVVGRSAEVADEVRRALASRT
jgi:very-short-patch-repair endonuclease